MTITKTKSQRRAERLAAIVEEREALEAEQVAYDKVVADAVKNAGHARCAAVEELYELLNIPEVVGQRRAEDGSVIIVRHDRDETKRAALLVQAVVDLVEEVEDLLDEVPAGHGASAREVSDQVRQWWVECSPRFAWDLLPGKFLYDLFKGWSVRNGRGRAAMIGRKAFLKEVLSLVEEFGGWVHPLVEKTRTGKRMDSPEPMVAEYGLKSWMRPLAVNHRWCLVRDGLDAEPVDDVIQQFWTEMRGQFAWDLLPQRFLYDLYQSWFSRVDLLGSLPGRNHFYEELRRVVEPDPEWADMKDTSVWSKGRMEGPEPLIAAYKMIGWYSTTYVPPQSGDVDLDKLCTPSALAHSYRGLLRLPAAPAQPNGSAPMAELPPEEDPAE